MTTFHWLLMVLVALVPILVSCSGRTTEAPKSVSTSTEKEYDIKGKVTAIGSEKRSVTLDHEEIPDLMKGMEMEFRVDDPNLLEGIAVGDQIAGRLRVQEGNYTIVKLQK